jgi:hypothetical protein
MLPPQLRGVENLEIQASTPKLSLGFVAGGLVCAKGQGGEEEEE